LCVSKENEAMRKLPEVQEAKDLMKEAMAWSALKWLWEKSRVRETADRANAVLDRMERTVKSHWSPEDKAAYKLLSAKITRPERHEDTGAQPETPNPRIAILEEVHAAHAAANRARKDAEATFDEAERRMSTSLAHEGCKKAIHSWQLHEKAIRHAESVVENPQAHAAS
jgi:hypothetical protein